MRYKSIRNFNGFTLIELLIVMALTGIISTAIYASFLSQEKVHKAQQLVSEMQQNEKVGMMVVSKDVRAINAYLGEKGIGWWDMMANSGSGGMSFLNGVKAYNNYDGKGSDVIDIAYANFDISTPLRAAMPNSSSQLKVISTDGFEQGMLVVISDGIKSDLVQITSVQPSAFHLGNRPSLNGNPTINPPGDKWGHNGYDIGAMIFLVKFVSYRIDHSDPDHPTLDVATQYDPDSTPANRAYEKFVEDIEDLQVAYIIEDSSGNESVVHQPTQAQYADIKSIRISIVARTRELMRDFPGSARPAIEDHTAGTTDKYQRRVLTEEILVRNLNLDT